MRSLRTVCSRMRPPLPSCCRESQARVMEDANPDPTSLPSSHDPLALYDEDFLPPTQEEHRLKTPSARRTSKPKRTPLSRVLQSQAEGTRSVDRGRCSSSSRSRSDASPLKKRKKKVLFPLKPRTSSRSNDLSLWDMAAARDQRFAKWLEERAKLDEQLDAEELNVTLDETFPDRLNTTI